MRYNIEFLRFVFTIAILLVHASLPQHSGQTRATSYIANGALCVDFFFILAGFFLYSDITQKKYTTKTFALKKYIRLAPVCAFSLVLHIIAFYTGAIKQSVHFKNELLNLFFIRDVGINSFAILPLENGLWATNTHLWYLGPLFWVSLFFYYVMTHFSPKKISIFIVIALFIITGLYFNSIRLCFGGLMRGFIGISMGIMLRKANDKINYTYKWGGGILWTIIEVFCFEEIVKVVFIKPEDFQLNFYFMLLFCVLLFSFYNGNGLCAKVLNKRCFGFMGRYCYSIYVMQWIVQNIIGNGNKLMNWSVYANFRKMHSSTELFTSLLVICLLGIVTYYLIERPCKEFLEKKISPYTK